MRWRIQVRGWHHLHELKVQSRHVIAVRDRVARLSAHSLARILAQKRSIDQAVTAVVDELKKLSKSTTTGNEITKVDAIFANADETIGESLDNELQVVEVVEGMQFDCCYLSRYFVSNPERQIAGLDDSYFEENQADQIQSTEYKSRVVINSSSASNLLAELPAA